jgi:hypothetical protein
MAQMNKRLKKLAAENPKARLQVILTASKSEAQLRSAGLEGEIESFPGLEGIYKGTFTGEQLLTLERRSDIDTVEPDDEAFALKK